MIAHVTNARGRNSAGKGNPLRVQQATHETLNCFMLAVLGFSFWFLMAVPFASHRETYWWLAKVHNENITYAFSFISSTYRPLHQITTWLAFQILDPNIFPTSVVRQAWLQLFVYGAFVFGWWLIVSNAPHRRTLALVAAGAGGVFFSGYVQLFHIYGTSYIPVILTLGILLRLWAAGSVMQHETWLACAAIVLVLWHPFTTALFVGFYFGYYLESFSQRGKAQHARALAILMSGAAATVTFVVGIPLLVPAASPFLVETAMRSTDVRLLGFFVSYQTNEVNGIASFVAFLLAQMVVVTIPSASRLKFVAVIVVTALGILFVWKEVPLLLLWILGVLAKLLCLRRWSLLFLALTAALLPFGGGIGTPIHGLFAVIIAAYVTALVWPEGDRALALMKTRHVIAIMVVAIAAIVLIRAGFRLPVLSTIALPLLAERERTYQLESVLAWLKGSDYCGYAVEFTDVAGNPVESVEGAIARQHRPPSSLGDVQLFWNSVLRCRTPTARTDEGIAVVTFGETAFRGAPPLFVVEGRYAGPAIVWLGEPQQ
jgi:hypothetical protein